MPPAASCRRTRGGSIVIVSQHSGPGCSRNLRPASCSRDSVYRDPSPSTIARALHRPAGSAPAGSARPAVSMPPGIDGCSPTLRPLMGLPLPRVSRQERDQPLGNHSRRLRRPPFVTWPEKSAHVRAELRVAKLASEIALEHRARDLMIFAVHVLPERCDDPFGIASLTRRSRQPTVNRMPAASEWRHSVADDGDTWPASTTCRPAAPWRSPPRPAGRATATGRVTGEPQARQNRSEIAPCFADPILRTI